MNWKLVVFGALAYFVASFAFSMVTGKVIHEGILDPSYQANEEFWQPALRLDPPDMGAMMPRWIVNALISALIIAAIYGCVRGSFNGPGWKRGATYGLCLAGIYAGILLGFSGVFYLPNDIWIWWAVDGLILMIIGGAALGFVAEKVAPA